MSRSRDRKAPTTPDVQAILAAHEVATMARPIIGHLYGAEDSITRISAKRRVGKDDKS